MMKHSLQSIKRRLVGATSLKKYCDLVNIYSALRGRPIRISRHDEEQIYLVDDKKDQLFICRRGRESRYKRGIAAGISGLVRVYHLDKIPPKHGGLLIDCGANVGELGVWARAQGMTYLPFEPEILEARCCDLNNFAGEAKTIRRALWKEATTLTFFSNADTADGSLIETENYQKRIEIEAVPLDDVLADHHTAGPIIFKLEAEGAEPEVLEGAENSLRHIDFVTVDCGEERGKTQENTFVACHDILYEHGFRLVDVGLPRLTALYRNIDKLD